MRNPVLQIRRFWPTIFLLLFLMFPEAAAQSSQVRAEWALFNQILLIGIVVGIVVFGLLFYAIVRFREKPEKVGAK